ncbi:MAG: multicopper oxidase family protein [Candidatus Magasanikbacteria bacterium]|nr:multicopper oxidase family protein [Candidatus Magasanikbacteria bacterium]
MNHRTLILLIGIITLTIGVVLLRNFSLIILPSLSTPGITVTIPPKVLTDEQRQQYSAEQRNAFLSIPIAEGIVDFKLTAQKTKLVFEGTNPLQINAWTYNGDNPGQELRITLGQTARVTLTNQLDEPTTIHWHGVRVPNAMDGVPDITQKSVQPGEQFIYEFTPKDAGTYWFHPHYNTSEQIERGLYGALIVEDASKDSFTRDETWVLDDWSIYNNQLYEQFNTPHDLMHDGRWGNLYTVNGAVNHQTTWSPGDRVRLRLINAANARVMKPDFGDLDITVLAIDGIPVSGTVSYDDLELSPGNRIDLAIMIPKDHQRSTMNVLDTYTRNVATLANIVFDDTIVETPEFIWNTDTAVRWNGINQVNADYRIELDVSRGGMHGINWMLNNEVFPYTTPIQLEKDGFTIIDFVNKSSRLHPMHLHGQFFRVIARDDVSIDEPYWRDTVLVNPRETVRIAFSPSDTGTWTMHCHILEHAAAGMMTTMEVK